MRKLLLLGMVFTLISCSKIEKPNDSKNNIDLSWVEFLFYRGMNLSSREYSNDGFYNQNVALGNDKALIYREFYVDNKAAGEYTIFNYSDLEIDKNGFNHIKIFNEDCIVVLGNRNVILYNISNMKFSTVDPENDVLSIPGIKDIKTEIHDLGIIEEGIELIPSSYLVENNISYNKIDTYYYWSDHDSYNNFINQKNPLAIRKNGGLNESIVINILNNKFLREDSDDKIYILNGYVDFNKMHLFKQNNRIKSAQIYNNRSNQYITDINFNDSVEFTELIVPDDCDQLKIVITEIYQGTKYYDLCITGVVYGESNNIKSIEQEKNTINKLVKK